MTSGIKERNERYGKYVEAVSPQTSAVKSLLGSFWIGGLTCLIAQLINEGLAMALPSLEADFVANITTIIVVFLAIVFTGFGFYDKIGRVGGAGSFLPITGFANAMASAGMEFKTEGMILGSSVKMFTVVGPVLVNGVVWSAVAALIRYLVLLI